VDVLRSLGARALVAYGDVRRGEAGQAMVEYALILFLVSIVSIAVLTTLGGNVSSIFAEINSDI
jgi:Flp pilus assembly pilin Flp